jgi:16S rRNA C967 or C1407 C5-methylase (RsmB/RsmF family)/NOL1/NOP2/fmu family ribosome biogenesis protein
METTKSRVPKEFLNRMSEMLTQEELEGFINHYNEPAPVSVRYNPFKRTTHFEEEKPVAWCQDGFYLPKRPIFTLEPAFHAGAYYVQEAASMFVGHVFNLIFPKVDNIRVLDLSAAPGGKSTHLLSLLPENSLLISNEVIKTRVKMLSENIAKWGKSNVIVTNNDPTDFKKLPEYFDLILIDAPCSGEGMFRKDPDTCSQWNQQNVQMCSQRQQRILNDIVSSLKPGGFLVYSTCTFSREENENNIKKLVEDYHFESIPFEGSVDFKISQTLESTGNKNIYSYRFYPHKTKGEGFFIACLKAPGEENEKKRRSIKEDKTILIGRGQRKIYEPWLNNSGDFDFINFRNEAYAVPVQFMEDFHVLNKALYIKSAGIKLGKTAGSDLIPDHNLALSLDVNPSLPHMELNKENAVRYLRKDELNIPVPDQKGWALVKFEGLNLGWVKILQNRINNYFPTDLRIRMRAE